MSSALEQMIRAWPGQPWIWDDRFSVASSTFTLSVDEKARAAIALAMKGPFTPQTLASAPQALRDVCTGPRSLRPGQLAFGGEPVDGVTPWALWWPWGGGQTITLRVGLAGSDDARLKKLFSLG